MSNDECQCLPCTLKRALAAWQSKHYLSTEGLVDQLGTFLLKAIHELPEFKGQTIGMTLLKELPDGTTERLH